MQTTRFFSKPLDAEYDITHEKQIKIATIQVVSGTCTFQGNISCGGEESTPIELAAGTCLSISPSNGASVLDGVTLTPVGGVTNLIAHM